VRRHLFPHDVQEIVGAGVPEELELPAQRRRLRRKVGKRAQIVPEAAILLVELEQPLRVGDCRFQLAAVADYAGILRQLVDVELRHFGHQLSIEAVKRRPDAWPLGVDDAPGNPTLKDSAGHDVEIVSGFARINPGRCFQHGILSRRRQSTGSGTNVLIVRTRW
jgi:hypothetical protein